MNENEQTTGRVHTHTHTSIRLINGDAYKEIKKISDKSIDLVIIDPPYDMETRGVGFHNKRDYYDLIHEKGLAKGIDKEIFKEFERVMNKINIYVFCNKNQMLMYLEYYKEKNVDILVWHKTNPIPTINNKYLSDLEYIVFIRDKGVKMYNTYKTSSKLYQSKVNKKDKLLYNHPTIKPLELIKKYISNSSKEGDTVLDCFMGSGTTGVACKELNRNFIGIEIDENYFNIAKKRIEEENNIDQISLF